MNATTVLSIALTLSIALNIALGTSTIFLGRELIKKFRFWAQHASYLVDTVHGYQHKGTDQPHTAVMSVTGSKTQIWSALMCFEIFIPAWVLRLIGLKDLIGKMLVDPFGWKLATSKPDSDQASADFELFLGRGRATFIAITNTAQQVEMEVKPASKDASLCKRHWFQR